MRGHFVREQQAAVPQVKIEVAGDVFRIGDLEAVPPKQLLGCATKHALAGAFLAPQDQRDARWAVRTLHRVGQPLQPIVGATAKEVDMLAHQRPVTARRRSHAPAAPEIQESIDLLGLAGMKITLSNSRRCGWSIHQLPTAFWIGWPFSAKPTTTFWLR